MVLFCSLFKQIFTVCSFFVFTRLWQAIILSVNQILTKIFGYDEIVVVTRKLYPEMDASFSRLVDNFQIASLALG